MKPTHAVAAALMVSAAVFGLKSAYDHHQREIGRRDVLLRQADSAHVADSLKAIQSAEAARIADSAASEARRRYEAGRASLALATAQSVAARDTLAKVRDSARKVVANPDATAGQLRVTLADLIRASDSASKATGLQIASLTSQLAKADSALLTFADALMKSRIAIADMRRRAATAETQRDILRETIPSSKWRTVERVAGGATILLLAFTR